MKTLSLKAITAASLLIFASAGHAARHSTTNCANKNNGSLVGNTNPRYAAAAVTPKSSTTNINNAESKRN